MIKQITQTNGVMNDEQTKNEKNVWKGRTPNPEYLPMKKCRTCGEVKSLDEFHKNSTCHMGYLHQCKSCQAEQVRNHHKTPEGRDTLHKALKKYYQSPKGKFNAVKAGHKQRGGGKIVMTYEEFADLLEASTECAICGLEFNSKNRPVVDHILAVKNKEGLESELSVENIQLLCDECSRIKGNRTLSKEDILAMRMARQLKMEE